MFRGEPVFNCVAGPANRGCKPACVLQRPLCRADEVTAAVKMEDYLGIDGVWRSNSINLDAAKFVLGDPDVISGSGKFLIRNRS